MAVCGRALLAKAPLSPACSAKKKGSDRRMQVVVRPAPGGGAYEVVLSYKGGVMGMKARQYVVTSFETSMGALRGTAPLSINVHTTQGTVDLTCTNIKQWCLFAAGLNGECPTRVDRKQQWHRASRGTREWNAAGMICVLG